MVRRGHVGVLVGLLGQLALLGLLDATLGLSAAGALGGIACALAATGTLWLGLRASGAGGLGPANRVTLARLTLVCAVAALVANSFTGPPAVTTMVVLTSVALALDGVDGWVARRTGSESALGARFDMEVDSLLVLLLSVYVAASLGLWVLAIGAARYLFLAAGWLLPWLRLPLPKRYWRKCVAVIQGIVLTIALSDALPRPVLVSLIGVAMALLAESFGRDVWWLTQHSRYRPAFTVHGRKSLSS